jgi:lysophospholipase L1-like esterase
VDTATRVDSTQKGADTATPAGNTYLALGDSYTIGQSVGVADRYPVQAVAMLAALGDTVAAPEIIAITGWTTANLLYALANTPPKRAKYGRVTLLIGVNNQFQGGSLSDYQTQFTELLQQSIHLAGDTPTHVIVLSIPDYADSFYGQTRPDTAKISEEIDQFNAANLQISEQFGVQYVNITDLTRAAKGDSSLFASDGLHYSGKEMALWAARLVKLW